MTSKIAPPNEWLKHLASVAKLHGPGFESCVTLPFQPSSKVAEFKSEILLAKKTIHFHDKMYEFVIEAIMFLLRKELSSRKRFRIAEENKTNN